MGRWAVATAFALLACGGAPDAPRVTEISGREDRDAVRGAFIQQTNVRLGTVCLTLEQGPTCRGTVDMVDLSQTQTVALVCTDGRRAALSVNNAALQTGGRDMAVLAIADQRLPLNLSPPDRRESPC